MTPAKEGPGRSLVCGMQIKDAEQKGMFRGNRAALSFASDYSLGKFLFVIGR